MYNYRLHEEALHTMLISQVYVLIDRADQCSGFCRERCRKELFNTIKLILI